MNLTDILDLSPPEKPLPNIKKKDDFFERVFAFVDSITKTKVNQMVTEADEAFYNKARFMIHRALSFSQDLIEIVNLVNTMPDLSAQMEYQILLDTIPSRYRRPKWAKKLPNSVYMATIQEYYGYNETKAEEAMKLLTVEDMERIDRKMKKEDSWTFSGGKESR